MKLHVMMLTIDAYSLIILAVFNINKLIVYYRVSPLPLLKQWRLVSLASKSMCLLVPTLDERLWERCFRHARLHQRLQSQTMTEKGTVSISSERERE